MKTLEQLLSSWEEGTLAPEEVAELKQALAAPEARAQLVSEWLLYEALYGAFRAEQVQPVEAVAASPAEQTFPAGAVEDKLPLQRPVARRRTRRWLVWYEFKLSLRWLIGAAAAACLVLAAVFFYTRPGSGMAIATSQAGVWIERGSARLTAALGQTLKAGDLVRVPAGGSAAIEWKTEATRMVLAANSEFRILRARPAKQFALKTGTLQATVAPQPSGHPMTISTPHAEAKVVGTRFTLAVSPTSTRLDVAEGVVELRKNAQAAGAAVTRVGAGQFGIAAAEAEAVTRLLDGFLTREILPLSGAGAAVRTSFNLLSAKGAITNLIASWSDPFKQAGTNLFEQRIRGYVTAPVSGDFYFWIASANGSELWLSPVNDPARKSKIAFVPAPAAPVNATDNLKAAGPAFVPGQPMTAVASVLRDEWNRSASQKSAPQRLKAGARYYIEVIHQLRPGEVVAVGWSKPQEPSEYPSEVIPGEVLSPIQDQPSRAP